MAKISDIVSEKPEGTKSFPIYRAETLEMGKVFAEASMGFLAEVGYGVKGSKITVKTETDQPVLATLGCQLAGWTLGDVMISGPLRIKAKKPSFIFEKIDFGQIPDLPNVACIEGETSDGAVMFVPAEAVFAEIHAYHSDLVEYAMSRRVWIVSPTTLMAVLNTARAVIKDVETRRQVHIIKDELGKLGKDVSRSDVRRKKLADHIRLANEDATEVHISSQKISKRFSQIESVDLEHLQPAAPLLPDAET